jgi:hypothetical protein
MHWGFLALVFIVSVAIGAARSKQQRPPRDEGGN